MLGPRAKALNLTNAGPWGTCLFGSATSQHPWALTGTMGSVRLYQGPLLPTQPLLLCGSTSACVLLKRGLHFPFRNLPGRSKGRGFRIRLLGFLFAVSLCSY